MSVSFCLPISTLFIRFGGFFVCSQLGSAIEVSGYEAHEVIVDKLCIYNKTNALPFLFFLQGWAQDFVLPVQQREGSLYFPLFLPPFFLLTLLPAYSDSWRGGLQREAVLCQCWASGKIENKFFNAYFSIKVWDEITIYIQCGAEAFSPSLLLL